AVPAAPRRADRWRVRGRLCGLAAAIEVAPYGASLGARAAHRPRRDRGRAAPPRRRASPAARAADPDHRLPPPARGLSASHGAVRNGTMTPLSSSPAWAGDPVNPDVDAFALLQSRFGGYWMPRFRGA